MKAKLVVEIEFDVDYFTKKDEKPRMCFDIQKIIWDNGIDEFIKKGVVMPKKLIMGDYEYTLMSEEELEALYYKFVVEPYIKGDINGC